MWRTKQAIVLIKADSGPGRFAVEFRSVARSHGVYFFPELPKLWHEIFYCKDDGVDVETYPCGEILQELERQNHAMVDWLIEKAGLQAGD
jgi:hypothetical protein